MDIVQPPKAQAFVRIIAKFIHKWISHQPDGRRKVQGREFQIQWPPVTHKDVAIIRRAR